MAGRVAARVGAWTVSRKRSRRVARFGVGLFVLVLLGWFALIYGQVTQSGNDAIGASADGDAIVVLGAAQYDGEPSPVLESRLDRALDLWERDAAPLIVTTGSNQPGDRFTEGFAGFRYLRNQGVPESDVVVVVDGGDTYESLLATANQLAGDTRTVVIVTDAYHARRSTEIAAEVGLDATVVAAGSDLGIRRRLTETAAIALGRVLTFRRLSSLR